ncbi:MAG: hypothetical protein KatS3mg112_1887 [Thermogutta sp.]|nr:MAG: hypothetical protein KatS3mg112_1887 [Thermogutta sp.]
MSCQFPALMADRYDVSARDLRRFAFGLHFRALFGVKHLLRIGCGRLWLALVPAVMCGLTAVAGAEQPSAALSPPNVPRQIHPWGKFEVGAWKVLRATTESMEDGRQMVSVTETRFTLEEVTDTSLAIRVEVLVEMAGKRFRTEPHVVRQGFHGEPLGGTLQIRDLGGAALSIEGRTIECRVMEVNNLLSTVRTVSKIWYSTIVPPYVLKKEATVTDTATGRILEQSTTEITVLDVPCRVGRQLLSASQVKTVQQYDRGTVTTLSLLSPEVPGAIVCQTSREVDREGRLVRRTTVELIDYGLQPTLRHPGGLRWHFLPRRVSELPPEWIRPGLLPELQGLQWSTTEDGSGH